MVLLLDSRRARRGLDRYLLASILFSLLAGVGLSVVLSPLTGVAVAGICLLALFPFFRAQADASAIVSFRNGGGMEDIRQTKLSPWDMLDGTTYHTMHKILYPGLSMGVIMVCLTVALSPNSFVLWSAMPLALAFFPAMVLVVWAQAYFAQMMAAWTLDNEATTLQFTAVSTVILPVVLAFPLALSNFSNGRALAGALVLILSTFWVACLSRLFAGFGLSRGDQVHRVFNKVRQEMLTRNETIKPWNDNPIVMRECARDAGRVGGGAAGAWAHYNWMAVLLAVVPTCVLMSVRAETTDTVLLSEWTWVLCFCVYYILQPARAASRISGAMTEERERRTLESLAVTPMTIQEFVDGWAEVGWFHRIRENRLAAPAFLLMAWLCGFPVTLAIALMPLLFINSIMGSYLGFAIGVLAPNRQESGGDVAVFLTLGVSLAIAAGFIYNGYTWLAALLWLYGISFLCLYLARSLGVRSVS